MVDFPRLPLHKVENHSNFPKMLFLTTLQGSKGTTLYMPRKKQKCHNFFDWGCSCFLAYRVAPNFCGSLFLQIGNFLCFAGTYFCGSLEKIAKMRTPKILCHTVVDKNGLLTYM